MAPLGAVTLCFSPFMAVHTWLPFVIKAHGCCEKRCWSDAEVGTEKFLPGSCFIPFSEIRTRKISVVDIISLVRLTLLSVDSQEAKHSLYKHAHLGTPVGTHTQAREYPRNTVTHTEGPTFVCTHALVLRQARGGVCSSRLFPLNEAF